MPGASQNAAGYNKDLIKSNVVVEESETEALLNSPPKSDPTTTRAEKSGQNFAKFSFLAPMVGGGGATTMQLHPNYRNLLAAIVGLFFLYLVYLLFGPGSDIGSIPYGLTVDLKTLVNYCVLAVESGGYAVRKIHDEKQLHAKVKGKTKEGAKEFVTKADLISNAIIMDLMLKFPGIQIVSEEKQRMKESDFEPYKADKMELWQQKEKEQFFKDIPNDQIPLSDTVVWIDPLDATQEYTEDLTQYVTVMMCIVVGGRPTFGVIYQPFSKQIVWGLPTSHRVHTSYPSAFNNLSTGSTLEGQQKPSETLAAATDGGDSKTIVVSRSHAGDVRKLAEHAFPDMTVEPAGGSGYKTLRVLNGSAEMYVHMTAIKKWDICAGDAIIRAAGGQMTTLNGDTLTYFAGDSVKNTDGLLVALQRPFHYLQKLQKAQHTENTEQQKKAVE